MEQLSSNFIIKLRDVVKINALYALLMSKRRRALLQTIIIGLSNGYQSNPAI
jgi:hypothetical protein